MSKIFSPFADGSIVEPKDFVGRRDIIEKFEHYLKDSINGNPNYFLITGEYYIGKSSFLKYLSFYAKEKYKIISCSWLIENTIEETIEELISLLLWDIKFSQENCYNKIIEDLHDHIIKIVWSKIKFTKEFLIHVKENFVEFFKYLYDNINDGLFFKKYKGLMIQFTAYWGSNLNLFFEWFNNIIDYCNKSHDEIPFIFTLELSKEEYNEFIDDEIAKYFICNELKRLSDNDVRTYFKNSFNKFDWEISDDVLDLLVEHCQGNPCLMQHAGNKIYYSISMGAFDEEEKKGYRVYGYVTNQKLTDPNFVREILRK